MTQYEKSIYLKPGTPLGWPCNLSLYNDYLEKRGKPHATWEEFKAISKPMNKDDDQTNESLQRRVWMTPNGEIVDPQADIVLPPESLLIRPQWE